VFSKAGYEAAAMDAIATEAGVAKQTIYNHFGSKDDLFRAIVAGLTDELLATLPQGGTPADVLRKLGLQFLSLMLRPTSLALHRMLVAGAERFPDLARELYTSGPDHAVRTLADWLETETRKGTLSVAEPETAAEQFYGMLVGHMQLRALLCVDADPAPEERERAVDRAVGTFLRAHAAAHGPDSAATQ